MVSENEINAGGSAYPVLILVLVEDGLRVLSVQDIFNVMTTVLILVLVEDGLRVEARWFNEKKQA